MATREMQLISRIVRQGCLTEVLEWGIKPEDFLTSEGRAMFQHIVGYYSRPDTAGSTIGENAAKVIYPYFVLCDDPTMTTPALCSEVRRNRAVIELKTNLQRAIEVADQDPLRAANEAQRCSADILALGASKNMDVRFSTGFDHLIERYEMRERGVDLSVAPWPWEPLNEVTGGVEPEDYIVFYGRPKSMKSWVLAYVISWLFNKDKRVLVYTKEMSWENIFMRIGACIAQVPYQGFRMGQLDHVDKTSIYALRRQLHAMRGSERLVCLQGSEEAEGGDTVPWLRSKIEVYKPDFVCVDGIYLMSDARGNKKDNERVRSISRDLRQMVLRTKVPLFATLQANRKAAGHEDANLDELAFSDAIGQDATNIMRVINEKTGPTIALVVGGAREFKLNGFRIHAHPATDFGYYGPLTEKEIQKAKEADAKGEEQDDANAHVKGTKRTKPAGTSMAGLERRIDKML